MYNVRIFFLTYKLFYYNIRKICNCLSVSIIIKRLKTQAFRLFYNTRAIFNGILIPPYFYLAVKN